MLFEGSRYSQTPSHSCYINMFFPQCVCSRKFSLDIFETNIINSLLALSSFKCQFLCHILRPSENPWYNYSTAALSLWYDYSCSSKIQGTIKLILTATASIWFLHRVWSLKFINNLVALRSFKCQFLCEHHFKITPTSRNILINWSRFNLVLSDVISKNVPHSLCCQKQANTEYVLLIVSI